MDKRARVQTGNRRWRWAPRLVLRILEALLVIAAILIGLRAWQAGKALPLEPWHTMAMEEAPASGILREGWPGYLAAEAQLFARMHARLDSALAQHDANPLNRYVDASLSSPRRFPRDWNRSYVLEAGGQPRGVAVLVHGLTDSPYSMLALARLYQAHGYVALVPRMPGHGTVPGALVRADRAQWQAVVSIAMDEARRRAGGRIPVHLVGYSNGAALALLHELDRVAAGNRADAQQLVLLSPMIKVGSFARYAGLAGRPGVAAAICACRMVRGTARVQPVQVQLVPGACRPRVLLVTAALQDGIDRLASEGRLSGLPPILAFQSVVDDTVEAAAVDRLLFDKTAGADNRLVLFDVNRNRLLQPLYRAETTDWAAALMQGPAHAHDTTVVGVASPVDRAVVARTRAAGANAIEVEALGSNTRPKCSRCRTSRFHSPRTTRFTATAPSAGHPLQLGAIALRGERNALVLAQANLNRLSYNPFHAYMSARIAELIAE